MSEKRLVTLEYDLDTGGASVKAGGYAATPFEMLAAIASMAVALGEFSSTVCNPKLEGVSEPGVTPMFPGPKASN